MNWVLWTATHPLDESQGRSAQSRKTKFSIPGPKRVIDKYRDFCIEQDVSLWRGLEILLSENESRG